MSDTDFRYFIIKEAIDNDSLEVNELPVVIKIKTDSSKLKLSFADKTKIEGPFVSKFALRNQSTIFSSIRLQKHKERVLNNKHIREIKDAVYTPDIGYRKTFLGALYHTMVGKISKNKVQGVHFYDPDFIRIVEIIQTNNQGVYSAIIEKLHPHTGQWVRKEEVSNFFPDKWSINKLFYECEYAYSNRIHQGGKVYLGWTYCDIIVKFIINENEKILTFYPMV